MANNVNINTNSNRVNVIADDNRVTITTDTKVVNVTEEVNRVIEVITRGPQGPKGADGSGGGSDLNALTTASVANNIITFTKGSGDQFNIRVDNVKFAQTASFILADNIRQPFTSVEATSLTGSLDYSYIQNVPDFVDTTGEIEENQIAIFAETFNGIPESLPFALPLENDGNPTIKGVSGLTFDGSLFRVQGIITGSNIPPNLINLQGNAEPNQLLKFVDTTDTELPIPLPFYVPVNDGNPTVAAVSGLAMIGNLLTLEGNISASGYISASTFYGDGSNLTGIGSNPFPYTGDAFITGNISASGYISASTFHGDGSNLTGVGSNPFPYTGDAVIIGNISASGYLSSSTANISGINYPITDGDNGDVLITDGAGNLSFTRTTIYANVKNVHGSELVKGMPVHVTGAVGNTSEVIAASASNAATMPAHFILNETLADDAEGLAIAIGYINGVNTEDFNEGDTVYVGANGGYTNVKPTGSNLIQNLGIVDKVDASNGSGFILGAGRSNDVPNIPLGYTWVGNSDQVATAVATSSFIQDLSSYSTITQLNSSSSILQSNIDGKQDVLTFGIANTNTVQIDSGDVVNNDYAQFTTTGLQGRSTTEVKTDLSLNNVENTALSTYTGNGGALDNQYITNGAGYTTNTGSVTSVGGTGTVSGLSLSGTVTTSGNLTLGGTISISSTNITDVDAFSQSGTYASLRAQGTTKGDVGLGNVENTALSTWAGSSNLTTLGTVTSGNINAILPSGLVSGSSQININSTTGTLTTLGTVTSGDISAILPVGTVSGSSQIVIGSTTGTITSAKISDVDAFSQSGTYANLRAKATTAGDVGLGNVENTALSTWTGSSNLATLGTVASGDVSAILPSGIISSSAQFTTFDNVIFNNITASGIISASSNILADSITLSTSSVQDTYIMGFSRTADGIAGRSSYFLSLDNITTALKNANYALTNFPISASNYYNRVIPCDDMTIADGKSIDITGILIVSGASNPLSNQVQIDLYTASITPNNSSNLSDPLNFTRAFQGSNISLDISSPFNSIHHFTQSFDVSTLPTNSLIAVALSNDSATTAVTTDTNVSISLRLTRNYKKKN